MEDEAAFVQTLDELRQDRYARPLASPHVLFWYPSRGLRVISGFGSVSTGDMRLLVAGMEDEAQPGFHPFKSLVDLCDIDHVDPDGFAVLVSFMRENAEAFAKVNLSSAYVHGEGDPVTTSAVAGYARLAGASFPTTTHFDAESGFAALGFESEASRLAADLAALKTTVRETFALLVPLERAIRDNLSNPSAEQVAAALDASTRTLQRQLSQLGTTLTREVRRVRIAVARERLLTDCSMNEVAEELGFSTVKAFRDAFKRELGTTPSEWRAANRRGGQQ